jgi:hypothetical protein
MGTFSLQCVLLLSAIGSQPLVDVPHDRVDLIEVNHFHDDQGKLIFAQVVFYEWCNQRGRHQVQAWRLLKNAQQKPRRDFATGEYVALWHDGETLREVRSPAVRESWTQYDPELVERAHLPKEKRKDLAKLNSGRPRRKPEPPASVATGDVARN